MEIDLINLSWFFHFKNDIFCTLLDSINLLGSSLDCRARDSNPRPLSFIAVALNKLHTDFIANSCQKFDPLNFSRQHPVQLELVSSSFARNLAGTCSQICPKKSFSFIFLAVKSVSLRNKTANVWKKVTKNRQSSFHYKKWEIFNRFKKNWKL